MIWVLNAFERDKHILNPSPSIFGIFILKYSEKVPKIIYTMTMIRWFMQKVRFLFFLALLLPASYIFASDYADFYDSLSNAFAGFVDPNAGLTSFSSLTVPLGGRSEAMAGAYTAMTDDIAFLNYNPAVSAVLPNTELAVFHNFWIADSAVDTIAFSQRATNFGYGAALKSFYVPFTEYSILGEKVSQGYYSETVGLINLSYNFFSGYHFKGLAVGTNLKFGFRGAPDFADDDTNQIVPGSGLSQSAIAVMGDLGFLLRFNAGKLYSSREPNLSIGLSFNNAGAAFVGLNSEMELDDPLPSQLAFGVSYKMIRPITISFDFIQPINLFNFSNSELFSFGFGIEGVVTDFFSLQGGFLLKGGNPKISLGSEVDWKGLTFSLSYALDLTTSFAPVNRISLSAKLNFGDRGRSDIQDEVDALYAEGLRYYVDGQFLEAIAVWEEALELFPRFDPALDGIRTANQSLQLRTTIQEVQSLDITEQPVSDE